MTAPIAVEPWLACDAAAAAARLRGRPGLAWLDSALVEGNLGRWSVVASDPRWTLTAYEDGVLLECAGGPRRLTGGALHAFARLVEAEQPATLPAHAPEGLPFAGGAIGYLGFELGREVERVPSTTRDDTGAPVLAFGWYDAALVWDGVTERGWLVGRPEAVAALRCRLEAAAGHETDVPRKGSAGLLRTNMTRQAYLAAVERARAYIAAGDIYQVNLTQRFSALTDYDGFDLYRRLRAVSPAPFAAYLDVRGAFGGVEVLSSSPERFLRVDGSRIETRPIKGTRPRGATPAEDARMASELRASTKDLAEHVMIVDLERNDLGRIAVPGSVRVPSFAALESYRQVHHLVSTVEAERAPGVDLEATLRATFPGGSISGAPKVRALEIIDELEPTVRGVYCGSIGYVSAHGRIDLNIAIRTITLADGVAHLHVGGAIVYDSDPDAEYDETLAKARGMARALGVALPDEAAAVEYAPAQAPRPPVTATPGRPAQPSMAWVGDRLVPRDQATVPLDDFATRYGAAMFETMLARHGRVFRLQAHLDRLARGLRGMGVEPPPFEAARAAIDATLAANGLRDASLRLVVSAGSGRAPNLEAAHAPLMTLTADALPAVVPSAPRLRVVSVRLDEHRPLSDAKTANFLTYLLARREARLAGADDALLLNHAGDVAEAAAANLFALLDGVLVTPPLEAGPIAGITRAAVIEVARVLDVPVAERRIALGDLMRAEAVLLTNSIAGPVSVASVEGAPPASPVAVEWRAPASEPPVVARLREAYLALVERECAVAGAHSEA